LVWDGLVRGVHGELEGLTPPFVLDFGFGDCMWCEVYGVILIAKFI